MPYSKKSKFEHKRQRPPGEFEEGTFRNVPISHVLHKKKYPKGTEAIVGKEKETGKYKTQSILIPKRKIRARKTRRKKSRGY